MNCVIYARVSTQEQADKALSLPAQLEAMREYARQRQWTIVEEFVEPGASAKTTARPSLQRLLAVVRDVDAKVGAVIVHKIDRLARNVYDHATIRALFKQRQVQLASVVENVDDTVSGQLVENIMASIAQFYSANLSDETKKGMRQKVLQGGWPHKPPRGYVVVKKDSDSAGTIEEHPREAALVKSAFALYATGAHSIQDIGRRLAKEGLVSRSGGPIPKSQIHRMLTNQFYAGRVIWKGLDVEGRHPSLVSWDLFEKVKKVIADRYRHRPRGGSANGLPLRGGLAVCATCRGRMTGEWHERWGYYRCGRQSYRRELCASKMCGADRAHADIKRILLQLQISRTVAGAIQTAADQILVQRDRTAGLKSADVEREHAELAQLGVHLTECFTKSEISPEEYRDKLAEVRRRENVISTKRKQMSATSADISKSVARTLALATSIWDLYEGLPEDARPALLRSVFGAVVLSHEGVIGYSLNPPLTTLTQVSVATDPESRSREQAQALIDVELAA